MSDVHTKEQRSRNMAAIKGKSNLTTEIAFLNILRRAGIIGWHRHRRLFNTKPDFVFYMYKVAVFTDGCFWHGCKKCIVMPKTNTRFWKEKINENIIRDKRNTKDLKSHGWRVLRVWEHEIKKNPNKAVDKIQKLIEK